VLRSKLFINAFSTIVVGVVLFTAAIYLLSVPWIGKMVANMEEHSGQAVLNSVYELAENANRDIEAWRESALASHKRELRDITLLVESYIRQVQAEVARGRLTPMQAKRRVLKEVRQFKYGNNDYVWISDDRSRLISHPDPKLNDADFSAVKDIYGNLIVPPMVQGALRAGEGYHSYWWRRLGEEKPVEKLTYYRNVPEWGWVIGTGVYVDEVENEVQARRQAVTEKLRQHLHATRIGNTGYLYVFDATMQMLIHPNANIEHTNIANLVDPATGRPIAQELIAVAGRQDDKLLYKWDKPSDPGHYVYDKIAWVRHVPGFDWYIASSVYLDELTSTADILTKRILVLAVLSLGIGILGAYVFLRQLIVPISRLADTARKVGEGDLSVKTDIARDDEIGTLARVFNAMVDKLKDHIEHLEERVAERTSELSRWVGELERRNRETAVLSRMGDLLQACRHPVETFDVMASTALELFPQGSGQVYLLDEVREHLALTKSWGDGPPSRTGDCLDPQQCWAVRRAKPHGEPPGSREHLCHHGPTDGNGLLCVPLLAQGAVQGVMKLHVRQPAETPQQFEAHTALCETIAEHAALALVSLQLRERLHQQSIRDALTGLFNRRYLDEALEREISRARRHAGTIGVVMVDVDHFKQINDSYGHETGDAVLQKLGGLIADTSRGEDIACRFGGEEFTLLLIDTDRAGAHSKAEVLRRMVEQELIVNTGEQTVDSITISLGVAAYPRDGETAQALLQSADQALYEAKHSGRNRVVCRSPSECPGSP
jgi:diguanylate cyclase (GGDEF)-like protein